MDIANFFGEGDLKKIVEIGGGYGGLCRSINCLCDFEEYHIYDLESCGKLQKKYLSNFNISGEVFFHSIPVFYWHFFQLLLPKIICPQSLLFTCIFFFIKFVEYFILFVFN